MCTTDVVHTAHFTRL